MHLRLINLLLCKTFTIFQVSAGQTRAEQIRISQIGLTQPCAGQIRPHQIRISKIRSICLPLTLGYAPLSYYVQSWRQSVRELGTG